MRKQVAIELTKRKGDNSTLRKVWNDDRTELLGVVGTYKDLLDAGIVEKVTEYSLDTWCCVPMPGRIGSWRGIGETRDEAVFNTLFEHKLGGGS